MFGLRRAMVWPTRNLRVVARTAASSTLSRPGPSSINTVPTLNSIQNWGDRFQMQRSWNLSEKGWQVEVEWKNTEFGLGVFAKQDIAKGTVLRYGRWDKNLIQFKSGGDLTAFCKMQGPFSKEGATEAEARGRVGYVSDYLYGFDPNDEVGGADSRPSDETGHHDDTSSMYYGMWVPGNGLNHSEQPNILYICAEGGAEVGIDLTAYTDIKAGEQLMDDYRRFKKPAAWAISWAKELGAESMNFEGHNDFVDK